MTLDTAPTAPTAPAALTYDTVPTPALVIDEARLDANIAAMAHFASRAGLGLRPHVKTHKSIEIARRQVAAGAVGITVATISEAEVFAAAGFSDIFIAYPLWLDAGKAARLRTLLASTALLVGIDSIEGARRLADAVRTEQKRAKGDATPTADDPDLLSRLAVVIEIDSGHHRSGAAPHTAGALAVAATGIGLDVAGVFTFPGHSYSPEGRAAAAADEAAALRTAVESLAAEGIPARIVSGGSTPSAEFADATVLTEMRPGVYVFGDAQQWELGTVEPDHIALSVLATVVSNRPAADPVPRDSDAVEAVPAAPAHLIADCGSKVLSSDRAPYATGYGRLPAAPDARITALSEHHATITGVDLAPGTRIAVLPNHVCVAVNLADCYVIVRDGEVIGEWPVDARGANQ